MTPNHSIPSVGFVSLGCPKALVDTERIVTDLRAEGYRIAKDYRTSDLVIVNTCAFIDAAVAESIEAVTEALRENGRVIVTGCLGGKKTPEGENWVMNRIPKLLGGDGAGGDGKNFKARASVPAAAARTLCGFGA